MTTKNELIGRHLGAILGASALVVSALLIGVSPALADEGGLSRGSDDFMGVALFLSIGAIVVASIVAGYVRRRETEKTIRAAIERGQTLDVAVLDRLLGPKPTSYTGLVIGGVVTVAFGIGLAVMSFFVNQGDGDHSPEMALIGAGAMFAIVGAGLLLATRIVRRMNQPNNS